MPDRIPVRRIITNGVGVACIGVQMRVRRKGAGQAAAKRIMRNRVEFVIQAHGNGTGLNQGPGLARMADNIGIDRVAGWAAGAGYFRFTQGLANRQ